MRRVAGVHMRASRHRIAALTNQEGRRLAPSLRSNLKKGLLQDAGKTTKAVPAIVTSNVATTANAAASKPAAPRPPSRNKKWV
ncbi:unnamed protein product [Heligmosomoides polygyrus]|uniref:Uncharacterized protein n=1 Tax=Heligmosomoides polygyrus TaxID=6339 RepID=A0A183FQ22_HELPZ|nr:unnamed protein product [Heligmosomoides polygyrus]